jgi:flagellar biogenesis protein FliO
MPENSELQSWLEQLKELTADLGLVLIVLFVIIAIYVLARTLAGGKQNTEK